MKAHGSTVELLGILEGLNYLGASGTDGGAVKCVDIVRNAEGESSSLEVY